jgi:hypothetical protein
MRKMQIDFFNGSKMQEKGRQKEGNWNKNWARSDNFRQSRLFTVSKVLHLTIVFFFTILGRSA